MDINRRPTPPGVSFNWRQMRKIYVAGKFSAPTHLEIEQNILTARKAMAELVKRNWAVLCPHANSAGFQLADLPDDYWYQADLAWLVHADAIFMLKDWEFSKGARAELEFARANGIAIFYEKDGFPMPEMIKPTQIKICIPKEAQDEAVTMAAQHLIRNARVIRT
jgi:hypothetical protein